MDLDAPGFRLERRVDDLDPSDTRLVLLDSSDDKLLPLSVDFLSPRMIHRRAHGLGKGQPLPRALGLKSMTSNHVPYVVDATAGLGTDAFIMAALGCRVIAIERSKVIHALLEDGYRRLRRRAEFLMYEEGEAGLLEIADRLRFLYGDAAECMRGLGEAERPDIVYMDPMYPEEGRSKSALPKKGMQMFRRLVGEDLDALGLFRAAESLAKRRVVVKRPLYASPLSERPTHSFEGKTARFDMYLVSKG